jgi:fructan beta-fructosidase
LTGYAGSYCEAYRPQIHFTCQKGYLNDPNGLVYFKGEYHLFFQHNLDLEKSFGNKHWGHAVSTDLVHWEELSDAIGPTENYGAFSGSAVVDWQNTTGLQSGQEPPLVAMYTSWGRGQCLAYSYDRGRTWKDYPGNPVLELRNDTRRAWMYSARDPKVFWHDPTHQWVMVLFQNMGQKPGRGYFGTGFHGSPDLKNWTFLSHLEGLYVCPDLFPLPVDGDKENMKWVLMDWAKYMIGHFDGTSFTPEGPLRRIDVSDNFSANQTWNDMPQSDSRRVQIAWLEGGQYPDMLFDQQMTFPCELSLQSSAEGIKLRRQPIKEIERLHHREHNWTDLRFQSGIHSLPGVSGDLFDIRAEFRADDASEFGFNIYGMPVTYNARTQLLRCQDLVTPLRSLDSTIRLQILVDKTSLEVFANEGEVVITKAVLPSSSTGSLAIFSKDGTSMAKKLNVYELNSIWARLR